MINTHVKNKSFLLHVIKPLFIDKNLTLRDIFKKIIKYNRINISPRIPNSVTNFEKLVTKLI